ncbi:MAG: glycosyltransferase [Ferruginibacter sp.]|nr:glycosyltransferase [Ferruginibacter sp.]
MPENKLPLISVCVPTYNKVNYVERLLDSIDAQSYKNIEVLIADNSEGEAIAVLAEKYKDLLPGLIYKKNDPPVGMAENHNEVTKMAKGDWVKIMHSDDWFAHPASLQIFADAALLQNEAFFIFSGCTEIALDNFKQTPHIPTNEQIIPLQDDPLFLFNHNIIGHPSTMMHKNTKDIFYDPDFKWVVDIDFYMRFLMKYKKIHFIGQSLINIGIDNSQESASCYKNPAVEIPEYFNLLNKYSPEKIDNISVFHAFWKLMKKFAVRSHDQIRAAGYNGNIPPAILDIVNIQKNIPRILMKQTAISDYLMKKCFSRFIQKALNRK